MYAIRSYYERYEVHHGVDITDPALVAAATLSHRYISDRQLPDKAIDLMDEAASRIRMEIDSKPEALDRLERQLIHVITSYSIHYTKLYEVSTLSVPLTVR